MLLDSYGRLQRVRWEALKTKFLDFLVFILLPDGASMSERWLTMVLQKVWINLAIKLGGRHKE